MDAKKGGVLECYDSNTAAPAGKYSWTVREIIDTSKIEAITGLFQDFGKKAVARLAVYVKHAPVANKDKGTAAPSKVDAKPDTAEGKSNVVGTSEEKGKVLAGSSVALPADVSKKIEASYIPPHLRCQQGRGNIEY